MPPSGLSTRRSASVTRRDMTATTVMLEMFTNHLRGEQDHSYRLWTRVNFDLWHRMYVEGQSVDSVRALTTQPGLDAGASLLGASAG